MKHIENYNNFSTKLFEKVSGSVSVRFAPSPTGALHIGGVRTAIYNYLFAKKYNGRFILRIEDTDSSRFVPGAEKYIYDAFDWLGIEFDESPRDGGPYGPYRQSERKDIYEKYYKELIDKGLAYYSFDTEENLNDARSKNPNFSYNYETRLDMLNSLVLPKEETELLLKERNDWVIRIKYPDSPVNIEVNDIIRGKVVVSSSTLDDKVIWKKKDELPTYHLANIVDDHLMKITHVIRGEEWLPSAPLHVYLYECFGWNSPEFAHLPLILGPSGKLSKRDGDKYGFPVFPLEWIDPKDKNKKSTGYKEDGYLPEAVINLLCFIGWNPGTDKEIYTLEELINDFDLKRINKAGGRFNPVKAAWFNGQHLKDTPTKELLDDFKKELKKRNIKIDDEKAYRILDDNKGKVNFIKDLYDTIKYLFEKPTEFDQKTLKRWKENTEEILTSFKDELATVSDWSEKNLQKIFEDYVSSNNLKFGDVAPILRLVLTGYGNGPSLFGIMEIIGKEEVLDRLSDLSDFSPSTSVQTDSKLPSLENDKLIKELENLKTLLKASEIKLSNKNFVERAPANVVESEKEKVQNYLKRIEEINNILN